MSQPHSQRLITSTSPATGRILGDVPVTEPHDAPRIIDCAREASHAWGRLTVQQRLKYIRAFKDALYRRMEAVITVLCAEGGKPPTEALGEYWAGISTVAYTVGHAVKALAPRTEFEPVVLHRRYRVERRPFGVVLVISPWNFPFLLSIDSITAALAAGNAVVYKPSEYATQIAEQIGAAAFEAGFPPNVFQVVHGYGDTGAALIRAKPDKICFTGSVANGRKIAAAAGELLIPVTLELGGKDSAIVLEDADLDYAARGLLWGGMINAGQTCASVENIYVMHNQMDTLISRMIDVTHAYLRDDHHLGILTTPAQVDIVEGQVNDARARGAIVIIGGRREGHHYAPTLITNVTPDMRICREETFGPVIVVTPVSGVDEAVAKLNASPFGLTASVWTRNQKRGLEVARHLQVGHVNINEHTFSTGVPNLPWGGMKDSGYGRTHGIEGIREMTTTQVIGTELIPRISSFFWYPYTETKYRTIRRAIAALYAPTWQDKIRDVISPM